jgi:hypothetical protein
LDGDVEHDASDAIVARVDDELVGQRVPARDARPAAPVVDQPVPEVIEPVMVDDADGGGRGRGQPVSRELDVEAVDVPVSVRVDP